MISCMDTDEKEVSLIFYITETYAHTCNSHLGGGRRGGSYTCTFVAKFMYKTVHLVHQEKKQPDS